MFKKMGLIVSLLLLNSSCVHKGASTAAQRDPQAETEALIRYQYEKGELKKICEARLERFQEDMEKWRSSHAPEDTKVRALLEFEELTSQLNDDMGPLTFMGSVSTVDFIRDESSLCEEKAGVVYNEVFTNKENYQRIKAIKVTAEDEKRLLSETKIGFEMNGMALSDADLKIFKGYLDELSKLSVQFGQNLNNDVSTITATAEELKGAKEDFLARLKKDDKNNYIITTKHPDYVHVMENVSVAETRKRMLYAYLNRQADVNTILLQKTIGLRAQIGKMLGYPTFADYALQQKMAKDAKSVYAFLNGLRQKLEKKTKQELQALRTFKLKTLKDSSPMESWDVAYLSNLLKIQKYKVDNEVVKEYFPADHVVRKTFEIYAQILGVKFRKIEGAPVWSPDVNLFEISDAKTKKVIGHFYADLVPRAGKYGHAAAFSLINGRSMLFNGGVYQKPVSAMVANFTPSGGGKPSLLTHDEVETYFHEFGHIMHQTLTQAKFGSLSGSSVKRDFVEAPSQMLENWVWQKNILKEMSAHYTDTSKKLPDDLIARLQKAQLFNSGLTYSRQLVFGFFDMNIHTHPEVDVTAEYNKIYKDLIGLEALEGTHFPATFGHMMGGYSAGYYGYLWSKVFAEDMFSVFQKAGVLNAEVGARYRHFILEQGNMKDPLELTSSFLKRKPNNKAFFKSLGL